MSESEKAMAEKSQLRFWQGAFGDDYAERNAITAERLRARELMWTTILERLAQEPPRSILEVGANVGLNLRALRALSNAELFAVEPNDQARRLLLGQGVLTERCALDGAADTIALPDQAVDLVFTSGVLIHIAPEDLLAACREMHRVSRRFLLSIEYFSDREETVTYRGHDGQLFKRDFGGFWLDNFSDLEVVDYGFFWKRLTGLDNLTWWLLRKTGA